MKPRIDVVYEGAYTPSDQWKALQVVTKRIALASTLLLPASATGRAVTAWGARQAVVRAGTAIQAILSDPVSNMRRTNQLLDTYKHATHIVGAYNYFNKMRNYTSSGSSSRAYQQNGYPGGTSSLAEKVAAYGGLAYLGYKYATEDMYKLPLSSRKCRPGFVKKKIGGNWMCVRKHSRKK